MGFFKTADPAKAGLTEDLFLESPAVDEASVPVPRGRRGKKNYRRATSMDSTLGSGSGQLQQDATLSSKRSPLRKSKKTSLQRCSTSGSSASGGMKGHLEDIEAFCKVMQDAGKKQREEIIRSSVHSRSSATKKKSPPQA